MKMKIEIDTNVNIVVHSLLINEHIFVQNLYVGG